MINNGVTLHGITRSKQLAEIFNKQGFAISYADYTRDWWALSDLENASTSPPEMGNGKLGIQIVDNDSFCNDALTGTGTSQRSNLVTPTENVNVDSDSIFEKIKVHATRLRTVQSSKKKGTNYTVKANIQ